MTSDGSFHDQRSRWTMVMGYHRASLLPGTFRSIRI